MRTYSIRAMCTMLSGHTCQYEESCVNTLLPPTVWYFFSIAFLTAASSLYVMNTNPLLFSVFGSCGSSIFSIYKRGENAFYASIFIPVCVFEEMPWSIKNYLSKGPKVLLNDFFRSFWVKASHKDFFDWLLLYSQSSLGVNHSAI